MTAYVSAGENINLLLRLSPFQPTKYEDDEPKDGGISIWTSYREIALSSPITVNAGLRMTARKCTYSVEKKADNMIA